MPIGTEKTALYGAAAGGFKATGGTITTYDTYTVHSFLADGTFSVSGSDGEEVDLLVVGGGGSGNGSNRNGGGGGGGVRNFTGEAVTDRTIPL